MELWIRSQSKETLVKVNEVYIDETKIKANYKEYYSGCDYRILGNYKSKERALEVLDEVQEFIEKRGTSEINVENGITNGIKYYNNVYNMPKE